MKPPVPLQETMSDDILMEKQYATVRVCYLLLPSNINQSNIIFILFLTLLSYPFPYPCPYPHPFLKAPTIWADESIDEGKEDLEEAIRKQRSKDKSEKQKLNKYKLRNSLGFFLKRNEQKKKEEQQQQPPQG